VAAANLIVADRWTCMPGHCYNRFLQSEAWAPRRCASAMHDAVRERRLAELKLMDQAVTPSLFSFSPEGTSLCQPRVQRREARAPRNPG
jgi:hypothetical protein